MAQLSSHPRSSSRLPGERLFRWTAVLVMELCSSALSERYRRERILVTEVLRIAVKIGSAIETAHRAGVLHRDINRPTSCSPPTAIRVPDPSGIASTLSEADNFTNRWTLRFPWSAPEVLMDETPGSIASREVWSSPPPFIRLPGARAALRSQSVEQVR
jgi:serine/threonine protein kinase